MWKSWKYKNLTVLTCSFILSLFLGSFDPFKNFVLEIGLAGAFAAGVIFISTFTAPIAAVTLLVLARENSLPMLWVIASFGAVISDFFFFKLTKDNIAQEIKPLYKDVKGSEFVELLHSRHFRWLLPIVGALIIFSPLPKAPGIHLLGIPQLKNRDFVAFSALINLFGIAFILLLSFVIKL